MGNAWFGKKRNNKGMVHPLNHHHHHHALALSGVGESGGVRLKVRMRRGQLKELMARVNMSKGTSQLGELILQECFNGTLKARLVVAEEEGSDQSVHFRASALNSIQEHSHD